MIVDTIVRIVAVCVALAVFAVLIGGVAGFVLAAADTWPRARGLRRVARWMEMDPDEDPDLGTIHRQP